MTSGAMKRDSAETAAVDSARDDRHTDYQSADNKGFLTNSAMQSIASALTQPANCPPVITKTPPLPPPLLLLLLLLLLLVVVVVVVLVVRLTRPLNCSHLRRCCQFCPCMGAVIYSAFKDV